MTTTAPTSAPRSTPGSGTAPAIALGLVYLAYALRFARILHAKTEDESRMLARDLLKVSVLYLPLLFTTLMLCAKARG